jgi:arginine repressor
MEKRDVSKEERLDIIEYIIRNNKIKHQTEIVSKLSEQGIYMSTSTINRDIKELKPSIDEHGYFVLKVDLAREKKKNALIEFIDWSNISSYGFSNVTTLSEKKAKENEKKKREYIYTILIKTSNGSEHTVDELIYSIFKDSIIGTQVGRSCITIYLNNRSNYISIKNFIAEQKKLHRNQDNG